MAGSRFGLLGEKLTHSFSPLIHSELGNYEYLLYEKKQNELEEFFKSESFDGLNITIPYKKAVIPFCNELTDAAHCTGSVNTILRRQDGSLYGDNTDCYGFTYLLGKTGIKISNDKIIILGTGGSSLAVQKVLNDMGINNVIIVSRSGPVDYIKMEEHSEAAMIINTTPLGMYPNNGVSPVPSLEIFRNLKVVIDLIYNPCRTEFLLQAEDLHIPAYNGLPMLVAQAKKSSEIFMDSIYPESIIKKISAKIHSYTQNIVLIGMPGSGKTSIGRSLAEKTGRRFFDTDDWVKEKTGKSPSHIINEEGEDIFRNLETEALKEICKESSLIISTGGGIVKREVNKKLIRQNGFVIFLDRDLNELSLSDRPLSQRDGVAALAEERLPIYNNWSDYTVKVKGIEKTVDDIMSKCNIPEKKGDNH